MLARINESAIRLIRNRPIRRGEFFRHIDCAKHPFVYASIFSENDPRRTDDKDLRIPYELFAFRADKGYRLSEMIYYITHGKTVGGLHVIRAEHYDDEIYRITRSQYGRQTRKTGTIRFFGVAGDERPSAEPLIAYLESVSEQCFKHGWPSDIPTIARICFLYRNSSPGYSSLRSTRPFSFHLL